MAATYRALTRKYRPQSFEDVVSQEHVSSTLKNAIKQNRLAHAYMFCGPRGVGKTTMARVLARAINQIDKSVDGESLSQTLNVVEIDAASNNKVEDVHHLREVVRVPPQSGTYKVFIIDEVHMLSKQAFNALLQTLEEPPPHAIFIFATTEPHKVLPTILSRALGIAFAQSKIATSKHTTPTPRQDTEIIDLSPGTEIAINCRAGSTLAFPPPSARAAAPLRAWPRRLPPPPPRPAAHLLCAVATHPAVAVG